MATTGLYSQHLHNRKVLYLRNTIIAIILIVLAVATLFPICYMFLSAFGPNGPPQETCAPFSPPS